METVEQTYDKLIDEGYSDYEARKIINEMEIFSSNLLTPKGE